MECLLLLPQRVGKQNIYASQPSPLKRTHIYVIKQEQVVVEGAFVPTGRGTECQATFIRTYTLCIATTLNVADICLMHLSLLHHLL